MASTSPAKTEQPQGTAGPRLGFLHYCNPKTLLRRDFYATGLRGSALTFIAVFSVVALYSVIAAVSVLNTIKYIKSRKPIRKALSTPKPPPGDFEPVLKRSSSLYLPDIDSVQEIPGEMELAALKDVMPSPELIPDIGGDTEYNSVDEREAPQGVVSDDDATLVGQDYISVKPSTETRQLVEKFERPLSPPATPPTITRPEIPVAEDHITAQEAPTTADKIVEKATEMTAQVIEEAAKAVEEHKQVIQDANKPELIVPESEPHLNEVSPLSEFVVVFDSETESERMVEAPKAAPMPPILSVAEPAPVQVVKEAEPEQSVVSLVAEPERVETPRAIEEPASKPIEPVVEPEAVPPVAEPVVVEESKHFEQSVVEEPKTFDEPVVEEPVAVEEPVVNDVPVVESKPVEEPQPIEAPRPVEEPKPIEEPKPAPAPKESPTIAPAIPKSLGRPRVVRKATASTAAVAGVTTSPASSPAITEQPIRTGSIRDRSLRRADDALSMLSGGRSASPVFDRSGSRSSSPMFGRSASPAPGGPRAESPSSDAAGSRPASPSPAPGTVAARRGSIASRLANVTNAPPRAPVRPSSRQSSYSNTPRTGASSPPPRGGAASPPSMPLPPQRQASLGRSHTPPPAAAVLSPNVLSRKATIDANGSPGSPPNPGRRQPSLSPARPPAEEFSSVRKRVPFPSAPEGTRAVPVPSPSPGRQRPKPQASTGSPVQASLLANLAKTQSPNPNPNPSSNSTASPGPGPVRRDSIASAVSNRDSILSVCEISDMDACVSYLDFPNGAGYRMERLNSMSSEGTDDEEKRKKRAKRRAKAKAQASKKLKRGSRN